MPTQYLIALIAGIFLIDAIFFLWFFRYFGGFTKVVIQPGELSPITIVYDCHTGPYQHVRPIMDRLYASLKHGEGIETHKGFALYFDDPRSTTNPAQLRSIAGCILEQTDHASADRLVEKRYNVASIPAMKAAMVLFPFKGPLSVVIARWRVYPKVIQYMDARGGASPVLEIYDVPRKQVMIATHLDPPLTYEQFV